MRMAKPLALGLQNRAFAFRGRRRMVIAVLGFFRLGGPARLLPEHVGWPLLIPHLPFGEPLDAIFPKPRGELLVVGSAHAPRGQPLREMTVRVRCGAIDKRLRVIGDRTWRAGPLGGQWHGEPGEFTRMPLDWAHAWGGKEHPENPAGTGYTGRRWSGPNHGTLPNVEYPEQPVRHRKQTLRPAGFGPVSLAAQSRQRLFGRHDARWLRTEAPDMAGDTDTEAFMAAPEDQRLTGVFAGGEAYRLDGLHPDHDVIEGTLPRLRVRVFGQLGDAPLQEAPEARLDTVWLIPEAELGVLIWRSAIDCAERDASDVGGLLLAYEEAADPPRSVAHYRDQFARRSDPKRAALHAFHDAPLAPVPSAAEQARRAAAQAAESAAEQARQQAVLNEIDAEHWARMGTAPPPDYEKPKADPQPPLMPSTEALANGDADLSAFVADLEARLERAETEGKARLDGLRAEIDRQRPATPAANDPAAELAAALADADRAAESTRPPLAEAIAAARAAGGLSAAQAAQLDQAEATLAAQTPRNPKSLALSPAGDPPGPEVAAHLRAKVLSWLRDDVSLAGRDLGGADLSGLDLRARDLSGVALQHADLRTTRLRGADLSGAALQGARLDRADLRGARLAHANLSGARARGARLRDADIDAAVFNEADLDGADLRDTHGRNTQWLDARLDDARFDGAVLSNAVFLQARGRRSRWPQSRLDECVFYEAELGAADFTAARLHKCLLVEARARASLWRGTHMTRCLATRADFRAARLDGLLSTLCSWRDADLREAHAQDARLLQADLGGARFDGADLRGALLAHSVLMATRLAGADLRGANLLQARAGNADFRAADLRDANLVRLYAQDADFRDARLDGAIRTQPGEAA